MVYEYPVTLIPIIFIDCSKNIIYCYQDIIVLCISQACITKGANEKIASFLRKSLPPSKTGNLLLPSIRLN